MLLPGSPPTQADAQSRKIVRGAVINTVGAVVRGVLIPLQMVVFGRIFGPDALGLFLWSYSCVEIGTAVSTSGFADAAVVFGSRFSAQPDAFVRHARSLLRITAVLSVTLALILAAVAYPLQLATHQPGLAATLWLLCAAIPLTALTKILVSIPKARQIMGHDVWALALALPLTAIAFAWPASRAMPAHAGIALSYTVAYACAFAVALFLIARIVPIAALVRGEGAEKPQIRALVSFAFPQNLNMGLNQLLTNTDLLILGALGASAPDIALYGIGAQIIGNIRQTRTVVADSLAPVLARDLHSGDATSANAHVGKATDWVMSLAVPAIALVACFPRELVNLFSAEFAGSLTFMYVLLIYPAFNCAFGLMGNSLIMSGHPKVNLVNSLVVGSINVVLCLLWIPRYGLTGAAMATALATAFIAVVQVIEARVILGMRVPLRRLLFWFGTGGIGFGWPFIFGAAQWPFHQRALAFAPVLAAWLVMVFRQRRRRPANHG